MGRDCAPGIPEPPGTTTQGTDPFAHLPNISPPCLPPISPPPLPRDRMAEILSYLERNMHELDALTAEANDVGPDVMDGGL